MMQRIYCAWNPQDVIALERDGYEVRPYDVSADVVLMDALAATEWDHIPRKQSTIRHMVSSYLRHEHTNYDALELDFFDREKVRAAIYKRACHRWPALRAGNDLGKLAHRLRKAA